MSYVGDFPLGVTLDVKFTTVNTTGVPTALQGTPVVSAYRATSVTQITTGVTLSTNFDSVAGLNNVRVDTSNATNFIAGNYQLVVTTGTVSSKSVVGYVVGQFSLESRSAVRPTTAGRTLTIESDGMAHADLKEIAGSTVSTSSAQLGVNVVNAAGTAWASGAITAASIANGAIDAATFAADVDAEILSYLVDDATRIDASALNTASGTSIPAILADTGTDGVVVASLNANVITAASMNADASAEIADAVWDEDATGHQTGGTFGQAIGDPVADTNTIFKAVVTDAAGATVGADTTAILEDTGTTLQAEVDGIQADTEDIQAKLGTPAGASVSADIAAVKSDTAAILVDTGTTLDGKIDTIDTNVDSILDDTGTSGVVVASLAANSLTAAALAADAGAEIADAVLNRDMSTGTDSGSTTVRTPRQALRALRNKVEINGTTLTVTKEDDSTASWTAVVTTTAGDPISAIDPAGP